VFPKPLVPLGEVPILEVLLGQLADCGIQDVTLALGHQAELVRAYFSHSTAVADRLALRYVVEKEPTGTAGSLALIPDLTETFLVMNGDLLTDLDFHALVDAHRASGAWLTIATYDKQIQIDLGVLKVDDRQRVIGYDEKPSFRYSVSMGVYCYEPEVLTYIKAGSYLDFPDLVLQLLADGHPVGSFPWSGTWLDIGRPEDYARAQELFGEVRPNALGNRGNQA
jgi:NDP-sugar pyrophosphorylase family protein